MRGILALVAPVSLIAGFSGINSGGDVVLQSGTGPISPGALVFNTGNTERLRISPDGVLIAGGRPIIDASGNWVGSPTGLVGPQGLVGLTGSTGVARPIGLQGQSIQGAAGPTGSAGPQGSAGVDGSVGPTGSNGIQGVPGPQGPQGLPYNPLQVALMRWYPANQTGLQFTVATWFKPLRCCLRRGQHLGDTRITRATL